VGNAFGVTFLWAFGMSLVALIPALALLRAERSARRQEVGSGTGSRDGKGRLETERDSSA
jgi:hypothetical protein